VKQRISLAAAVYIVAYVASTNRKLQADVLVVNWVNSTRGAVFGTAV